MLSLRHPVSRLTNHGRVILRIALVSSILFFSTRCTDPAEPPVHPDDWGDPGSRNFHGQVLKTNGWGFNRCQFCHGEDLSGGSSRLSCSSCHVHSVGIGTCTTCHGDREAGHAYPPVDLHDRTDVTLKSVGAHEAHMESSLAIVSCDQCHMVPVDYRDEGHLGWDNTAEITFGTTATGGGNVEPIWNRDDATCSAVHCHGNFVYNNISGNYSTPVWTGPGSVVCGSCHGIPPTGHFGEYTLAQCSLCHASVINSEGDIIDRTKHVNGERDFN
ncbi:MAG: CxxxxCH/CxxCH domain-containing protein [Candidatus Neomarinimicrobiota bacterium]